MESLTNVTFKEIKIGDSASVTRRLSSSEVEALALVGGDVDAFQIGNGKEQTKIQTEAVAIK